MQEKRKIKPVTIRRLITAALIIFIAVGYWAYSNFTFRTSEYTVDSTKIKEEITIVQISDLHGACYGISNQSLLSSIKAEDPDLILITGDLYTDGDQGSIDTGLDLVDQLCHEYTVYYVMGETDRNEKITNELSTYGVNVIENTYVPITIKGTKITLYGIDGEGEESTQTAINTIGLMGTETYNIVMTHKADVDLLTEWGADLVVSGATHGGIARLPLWGPVWYYGEWTPKVNGTTTIYDKGMYQINNTHIFVSGGLGNYPYDLRFYNRPQLCVLKLEPQT